MIISISRAGFNRPALYLKTKTMAKQTTKKKAMAKKVVKKPAVKKSELVKVFMLFDLQVAGKDLQSGTIQFVTEKQAGFWENPKRKYCKRV